MATVIISSHLCFLIFLLLSCQSFTISGGRTSEEILQRKNSKKMQTFRTKIADSTSPITNPANFPPFTPTPTIVTVPATNPTSLSPPVNPVPNPVTTVPTSTNNPTPIFNPANPGANPATQYPAPATGEIPPGNVPATTPGTSTSPGQSWCIAKAGAPESSLQSALDYACGIGGVDCSMIQQGASCYNPSTLENHASLAFNSYFQRNPVASSCDFGGTATLVNTNPSTGTCIYPSSAAQTAMPASMNPPATPTATPLTSFPPVSTTPSSGSTGTSYGIPGSGYGTPPSVFNTGNPASNSPAIFGPDSPPTGNTVPAGSAALQPLIGFTFLVVTFSTGKLILSI